MKARVHRTTLFALYQLCIAIGIVVMPFAISLRQAGYTIPVHRVLDSVESAYDDAHASMN